MANAILWGNWRGTRQEWGPFSNEVETGCDVGPHHELVAYHLVATFGGGPTLANQVTHPLTNVFLQKAQCFIIITIDNYQCDSQK